MTNFDLTRARRAELFEKLLPYLENYYGNTERLSVTSNLDPAEIRNEVRKTDFNEPADINYAVVYPVNGINSIRACITNYNTSEDDIKALVEAVNKARSAL